LKAVKKSDLQKQQETAEERRGGERRERKRREERRGDETRRSEIRKNVRLKRSGVQCMVWVFECVLWRVESGGARWSVAASGEVWCGVVGWGKR
jgi:hypothetical protein